MVVAVGGMAGLLVQPPRAAGNATAVLIQPNLDVGSEDTWPGAEWGQHMADFTRLAGEECKTYIAGIPQTGAASGEICLPALSDASRPGGVAGIAGAIRRSRSAF